jgi:actin-related protein
VLAGVMADKPQFWVTKEEWREKGENYCINKLAGKV